MRQTSYKISYHNEEKSYHFLLMHSRTWTWYGLSWQDEQLSWQHFLWMTCCLKPSKKWCVCGGGGGTVHAVEQRKLERWQICHVIWSLNRLETIPNFNFSLLTATTTINRDDMMRASMWDTEGWCQWQGMRRDDKETGPRDIYDISWAIPVFFFKLLLFLLISF